MNRHHKRQQELALFELFFEAHWQHLYIKAFKFLKNKDQACAIVQSIFIDLLQTKSFKEDRDWECHLSGLLKNKVLEQMRQYLAIDKSLEDVCHGANGIVNSKPRFANGKTGSRLWKQCIVADQD